MIHCERKNEGVLLRIFDIRYKALSQSKISRKKVINLGCKSSEITDVFTVSRF